MYNNKDKLLQNNNKKKILKKETLYNNINHNQFLLSLVKECFDVSIVSITLYSYFEKYSRPSTMFTYPRMFPFTYVYS